MKLPPLLTIYEKRAAEAGLKAGLKMV